MKKRAYLLVFTSFRRKSQKDHKTVILFLYLFIYLFIYLSCYFLIIDIGQIVSFYDSFRHFSVWKSVRIGTLALLLKHYRIRNHTGKQYFPVHCSSRQGERFQVQTLAEVIFFAISSLQFLGCSLTSLALIWQLIYLWL